VNTKLLACKAISDQARRELNRAGCTIHKEVPGLDDDIAIVELQYAGDKDLNIMFVWDMQEKYKSRREICISSMCMMRKLEGMSY
jgi:hypothetical protein